MDKEILAIIKKLPSVIDVGMSEDIKCFLESEDRITRYELKADKEGALQANIYIRKNTFIVCQEIWKDFVDYVGYEYLNVYVKEEENNLIKYIYYTATEGSLAIRIIVNMIGV